LNVRENLFVKNIDILNEINKIKNYLKISLEELNKKINDVEVKCINLVKNNPK